MTATSRGRGRSTWNGAARYGLSPPNTAPSVLRPGSTGNRGESWRAWVRMTVENLLGGSTWNCATRCRWGPPNTARSASGPRSTWNHGEGHKDRRRWEFEGRGRGRSTWNCAVRDGGVLPTPLAVPRDHAPRGTMAKVTRTGVEGIRGTREGTFHVELRREGRGGPPNTARSLPGPRSTWNRGEGRRVWERSGRDLGENGGRELLGTFHVERRLEVLVVSAQHRS